MTFERSMRVLACGIELDAELGIRPEEQGRTQRLIVHVTMEVAVTERDAIDATVDYRLIVERVRAIAASGRVGLIETFARKLGEECMSFEHAIAVEVEVQKPEAIAPALASVCFEIRSPRAARNAAVGCQRE